MWFVSEISILFHWTISLSTCQYHTVLIIVALWYSLKPGSLIPPAPFFLRLLWLLKILCFHTNFKIICFSSVKNKLVF